MFAERKRIKVNRNGNRARRVPTSSEDKAIAFTIGPDFETIWY